MFRKLLFWLHLTAGLLAAIVVVIMSVTGVALTYQRQMQAWADRGNWRAPGGGIEKLPIETLYERLRASEPDSTPTTITVRSGKDELATVAMTGARNGNVLVDPYTGQVVAPGPRAAAMRQFFSTMTSWHRYVAMTGDKRATGRAITGASNLAFLFLVVSGVYLWWPRSLRWSNFKAVLLFKWRASGKARDFNWHNVLGFWSAVPLAIVVASGAVISYPWASNLVYRAAGETPPVPAAGRGAGPAPAGDRSAGRGGGSGPAAAQAGADLAVGGLNSVVERSAQAYPAWRSLGVRIPSSPDAPVTVTVDGGDGGQPQKRGTLTIDRAREDVSRAEMFADQSTGRRWRSILRFAHTGEVGGLVGQTIAGLVSAASVVLAYTGLALALRRLRAWLARRKSKESSAAMAA